jgi:hypothetical protein
LLIALFVTLILRRRTLVLSIIFSFVTFHNLKFMW